MCSRTIGRTALTRLTALLTSKRVLLYAFGAAVTTSSLLTIFHLRAYEIGAIPMGDFPAFYAAAQIARTHPHKLYDLSAQSETQKQLLPDLPPSRRWQYVHPPFFTVLLIPLGKLSYLQAYWAWTGTSILLYLAAICILVSTVHSSKLQIVHVLLLAVSSLPFLWCIVAGQTTTLGLFLWSLAFYLLKRGRALSPGILLGFLVYRFQSLLIVFALLLLNRAWKLLLGIVAGASLLILVGGLVFTFSVYTQYLNAVFTLLDQMQENLYPFSKSISLFGFFRLFMPGNLAVGFTILAAMVLAYWLLKVWNRRLEPQTSIFDLQLSMAIATTPLLMYHSLIYDLMLLTIPVLLVYEHRSLFPPYYKLLLASVYLAPYLWLITHIDGGRLPLIQPILFWVSYEIYSAYNRMWGQSEKSTCTNSIPALKSTASDFLPTILLKMPGLGNVFQRPQSRNLKRHV